MKGNFVKLVVAIMMVLCLGVSAFAGGTADEKQATTTGPVTIDLWYGAAVTEAGPPPADWKALQIIKDKLNIDLKLTAEPSNEGDQDVKINAAAAANSLPDVFMVRRPVWENLTKMGVIAPVDSLYGKMPNRTKTLYDDDSIAFSTINGKSYGLAQPGSIIKNEGLVIRKDWLDKLGLKVPTTTAELMDVMKAFTFKDPDGNGKDDTYGYGAWIELNNYEEPLGRRLDPILGAFGVAGNWNMTKAKAGLNVRKPEYFDGLSYIKSMIDAKVIDPNWLTYKKDDFRAAWKQGRFGIMREQNAALHSQATYAAFDKNFPNGEWIVIDPPKGPSGKASVGVYTVGYRIYAVSAAAIKAGKGPAIAKLLEWMSSEEGYYLLGWGEKDVNFVIDPATGSPTDKGLADPEKAFSKPAYQPLTQLRNLVFFNGDIELASRYPTYTTETSGKTMSALKTMREMQAKAWTPAVGSDTLTAPDADLKRFYEQGVIEFLTGKRNLTKAEWTAWVAEFDKIGGLVWETAGVEKAKASELLK